ncbi:MAG: DUF4202 domain-containing protein [Dehalococcoidia bacterium]
MVDAATLRRALGLIDAANAQDPNTVRAGAVEGPRELVLSRLVSAWVSRLDEDPAPELVLAARGHHLRRWEHPRSAYPAGRGGYLRWRTALYTIHAGHISALLETAGVEPAAVARVAALVAKRVPRTEPDAQALEDALCLAFLEADLAPVAGRMDDTTMVRVLRKTWAKMSGPAHTLALGLITDDGQRTLVERALAAAPGQDSSG